MIVLAASTAGAQKKYEMGNPNDDDQPNQFFDTMKHFFLILSILVAVSLSAFNRPVTPADSLPAYYESIDGTSGKELMDAIQRVAKQGYRADDFRYDSVWLAFKHTDLRLDSYIWEIYSDCDFVYEKDRTSNTTQTGECKGYNREHAMCQSWFGTTSLAGQEMSSSKKNSPGSDIFHLCLVRRLYNRKV